MVFVWVLSVLFSCFFLVISWCLVVTSYLSCFLATLTFIEFSPRWFSYPQHAKKNTPNRVHLFLARIAAHQVNICFVKTGSFGYFCWPEKDSSPKKHNETKASHTTNLLSPWMDFSGAPIAGGMVMARSHLVSTSFRKSSSESPSWVVMMRVVPWWLVACWGVLRCG